MGIAFVKRLTATVLAAATLAAMPAALAAPVAINGDVSVKYEKKTTDGEPAAVGMIYSLRLKAEAGLADGWTLYARLGAQHAAKPELGDFNRGAYAEGRRTVAGLDQWGVIHKAGGLVYRLGRQEAAVGATTLLYNRPDTNIGKGAFVDGLSVSGTVGSVDVTALAAREDNPGSARNTLYAVRSGFKPREDVTVGFTLARYRYDGGESSDHWAVDGRYQMGKHSLTAEYTRSSSAADNKAYAAIWNYDCDAKTAVSVVAFRVEANGDMGRQSEFDNGNRGLRYVLTSKLSKTADLELQFTDQKTLGGGQGNTKLEATVWQRF